MSKIKIGIRERTREVDLRGTYSTESEPGKRLQQSIYLFIYIIIGAWFIAASRKMNYIKIFHFNLYYLCT